MYKKAFASVIDKETKDLDIFHDVVKVGDGKISLNYFLDGINISFGSLEVYSNGAICMNVYEIEYYDVVYNDYLKINGDNPKPKPKVIDEFSSSIFGDDLDVERWKRLKKYILDNNIELVYSEDLTMDRAEESNMSYEDYLEKERKDLESISIRRK